MFLENFPSNLLRRARKIAKYHQYKRIRINQEYETFKIKLNKIRDTYISKRGFTKTRDEGIRTEKVDILLISKGWKVEKVLRDRERGGGGREKDRGGEERGKEGET